MFQPNLAKRDLAEIEDVLRARNNNSRGGKRRVGKVAGKKRRSCFRCENTDSDAWFVHKMFSGRNLCSSCFNYCRKLQRKTKGVKVTSVTIDLTQSSPGKSDGQNEQPEASSKTANRETNNEMLKPMVKLELADQNQNIVKLSTSDGKLVRLLKSGRDPTVFITCFNLYIHINL